MDSVAALHVVNVVARNRPETTMSCHTHNNKHLTNGDMMEVGEGGEKRKAAPRQKTKSKRTWTKYEVVKEAVKHLEEIDNSNPYEEALNDDRQRRIRALKKNDW
jgi:hypothetical protein